MAIEDDGRRLVLESNGGAAIAIFYLRADHIVKVAIVDRRPGKSEERILTGSGSGGPHPAVQAHDFGMVILAEGSPSNYRLEVAALSDDRSATFAGETGIWLGNIYDIIASDEVVAQLIFSDH
jgi:hypothetical protein